MTPSSDRIMAIDAVRGFAVLGILLMNIVAMGLPSFAYIDPTYAGGSEGADLWTWAVNSVVTDGKMRALFTFLFGASTLLIADRAERAHAADPGALSAAKTHYRRMGWLLVFGVLHAVFFWFGDILVPYALAGLLVFPLRRLSPRTLLLIGAAVLAALLAKNVWMAGQLVHLQEAASAPGASAQAVEAWRQASMAIAAPPEAKAAELAGFGGGFVEATRARLQMLTFFYAFVHPFDTIPEAFGQILIGMALFRTGFFSLGWPKRAYLAMIAFGYGVCAPAAAALSYSIWRSGFDPLVLHELSMWQQAPRPFIALAHASVLLLLIQCGAVSSVTTRLAAAGRMAFSNYILTSVVTSLIFCGYGLGLYGELSRFQQLGVVLAVWGLILAWSPPWLARFHYGPLEWAWRSLVQGRPAPFSRRRRGAAPQGA